LVDQSPQGLRHYLLNADKFLLQWGRSPGKTGSHYDPNSDLFVPKERKDVITSTVCWTAMAALLVGLSFVMGPVQVLKLYGVPYWVNPVSLI
jgi:omega-3 fatty acid desaturase (delta-15 desaturase)